MNDAMHIPMALGRERAPPLDGYQVLVLLPVAMCAWPVESSWDLQEVGLSCRSQRGKLRLPVGKEAVQKENWLTGEPWASPPPPQGCAHSSQAAGVQGPPPPQCRRAGHRRGWARSFLDTRGPHCLGKLCSGWWPRVPCLFKNDDGFFFIKAPVFAKEVGKPF